MDAKAERTGAVGSTGILTGLARGVDRLLPAAWLGAGLATSFVAIPVVFSPAVRAVLPKDAVGGIAQAILGRYFWVQVGVCAVAWLARWRAGGAWGRWERAAWAVLSVGSLVAALWMHPKLQGLYRVRHDPALDAAARERAAAQFGRWHGISQVGNLVMLGALAGLAGSRARRPRGGGGSDSGG